jgi:hydrogenase maturation protease
VTAHRTPVAGVGNVFLGDDGFGVEVAQRLMSRPQPDGVQVTDFGVRGVHLAYDLLDGCDLLVLVDAAPRGEPPGRCRWWISVRGPCQAVLDAVEHRAAGRRGGRCGGCGSVPGC